jgi:hypothetical protein
MRKDGCSLCCCSWHSWLRHCSCHSWMLLSLLLLLLLQDSIDSMLWSCTWHS